MKKSYLILFIATVAFCFSKSNAQQAIAVSNQYYDNDLHVADSLIPAKNAFTSYKTMEELTAKMIDPVIYDSLPPQHAHLLRVGFKDPDYFMIVEQKSLYILISLKQFGGYSLPLFAPKRMESNDKNLIVIVAQTSTEDKKQDSTGFIGIFSYETEKMVVWDAVKQNFILDQIIRTVETVTRENNKDYTQTNHLEMNSSIKYINRQFQMLFFWNKTFFDSALNKDEKSSNKITLNYKEKNGIYIRK